MGWATFWAIFVPNSSGHPAAFQRSSQFFPFATPSFLYDDDILAIFFLHHRLFLLNFLFSTSLCRSRIKASTRVSVQTIEILDLEQVCWQRSCKYFGGKNTLEKSADLHPRQGNLLQWNIFTGLNETSLYYIHKIGWRPAEKKSPIFSTCVF
jgi:hypothetical protein